MGIPESFKVGWYPPKKLGRVTSKETEEGRFFSNSLIIHFGDRCLNIFTIFFSVFSLVLVSIEKIYQTLKTVFDHISKHFKVRQKYSATRHIFNSLLGGLKCGQTRSFVLDILHVKTLNIHGSGL